MSKDQTPDLAPGTLEDFREKSRHDWEAMDNKTLSQNIRTYRHLMISEARESLVGSYQGHRADLAVYDRINSDPDRHPTMGKASINLGMEMSKCTLFDRGDRTMCENLANLSSHRAKQHASNRAAAAEM